MKVSQIYPLFKGLNHIQGLDIKLGFTYISGLWGTRTPNLQTIPFDPLCGYISSWLISILDLCV